MEECCLWEINESMMHWKERFRVPCTNSPFFICVKANERTNVLLEVQGMKDVQRRTTCLKQTKEPLQRATL